MAAAAVQPAGGMDDELTFTISSSKQLVLDKLAEDWCGEISHTSLVPQKALALSDDAPEVSAFLRLLDERAPCCAVCVTRST